MRNTTASAHAPSFADVSAGGRLSAFARKRHRAARTPSMRSRRRGDESCCGFAIAGEPPHEYIAAIFSGHL